MSDCAPDDSSDDDAHELNQIVLEADIRPGNRVKNPLSVGRAQRRPLV
jgi:hypothetical protein